VSQYQDEGIIDVEKRKQSIEYNFGDPTLFPPEFLNWLKRFIEQSGIQIPASSIFGALTPGGTGSLKNISPGVILPFGGSVVPLGALPCNGQVVLINDYPKLHEIIGATWGAETGTTFTVPDLRDRTLFGAGILALAANDGQAYGSRGPQHRHTVTSNAQRMQDLGTNTGWAGGGGDGFPFDAAITVGPAGTPLDAPAYAVVNYVITTG
jgi:microcystin-dependent protein